VFDAPRVVAEVPAGPGYEAARAAVLGVIRLPSTRARDRVDLATPVRVRVTGFAFWDGAHWSRRDGVRGCGHGTATVATLWELHPVWRVEVLGTSRPDGLRVPTFPPVEDDELRTPRLPPTSSDGLRAPASSGQPAAVGERLRCCDGSRSPTCRVGRANGRGCCRGHGGVCGE
jgi:hypothetical protein